MSIFTENNRSKMIRLGIAILLVAGIALAWKFTPLSHYATPEFIKPILMKIRSTPWAVLATIGIYTIGTLAFFPHMAMTATIVLIFSPLQAFIVCMGGSLISASIGYFIGRALGMRSMEKLVGDTAQKVSGYAKKGGILGIALLRMLPIAPFTVVNITLAMLEVPYVTFLAGTFLGTLPGTLIASLLGFSAMELWENPDPKNMMLLGGGLLAWILIVTLSHLANRYWQKHRKGKAA